MPTVYWGMYGIMRHFAVGRISTRRRRRPRTDDTSKPWRRRLRTRKTINGGGLGDGKFTFREGEICLSDGGGDKIGLIFELGAARSYSPIRLEKSSSDLIEINVSKSPFGS